LRDQLRERRDLRREVHLDAFAESSARLAAWGCSPRTSVRTLLDREERAIAVADAMALLTDDQREAVILKYWHDWSLEEIGGHQGRSPSAVASLLHRALKSLKERVKEIV
jgi:RNA polymerase sigma factor (sigma-70 family)